MKRSARELIWGYEDPLLKALASVLPSGTVPRTFVSLVHNMTGPEEALALKPSIYDTGRDNLQNVWNVGAARDHPVILWLSYCDAILL